MTNTLNKIMHNGDEYLIPQYSVVKITLPSANWSNNEQTVSATGVTATNTIVVSPLPTSMSDYTDWGVIYTAQGTDSITFTCSTTPSNNIEVNVVILAEAQSTPTPPSPW